MNYAFFYTNYYFIYFNNELPYLSARKKYCRVCNKWQIINDKEDPSFISRIARFYDTKLINFIF